jgi:hypothetical protein
METEFEPNNNMESDQESDSDIAVDLFFSEVSSLISCSSII